MTCDATSMVAISVQRTRFVSRFMTQVSNSDRCRAFSDVSMTSHGTDETFLQPAMPYRMESTPLRVAVLMDLYS